jgi:hypothetical protein
MTWWLFVICGALGGASVEAVQLLDAKERLKQWPWHVQGEASATMFTVAGVIRITLGAVVAFVAGSSGQVNGAFGAFATGIAAPLVVQKILAQRPELIDRQRLDPPQEGSSAEK